MTTAGATRFHAPSSARLLGTLPPPSRGSILLQSSSSRRLDFVSRSSSSSLDIRAVRTRSQDYECNKFGDNAWTRLLERRRRVKERFGSKNNSNLGPDVTRLSRNDCLLLKERHNDEFDNRISGTRRRKDLVKVRFAQVKTLEVCSYETKTIVSAAALAEVCQAETVRANEGDLAEQKNCLIVTQEFPLGEARSQNHDYIICRASVLNLKASVKVKGSFSKQPVLRKLPSNRRNLKKPLQEQQVVEIADTQVLESLEVIAVSPIPAEFVLALAEEFIHSLTYPDLRHPVIPLDGSCDAHLISPFLVSSSGSSPMPRGDNDDDDDQDPEDHDDDWEYYDDEEFPDDSVDNTEKPSAAKKAVANLNNFGIPAGLLSRWDYTIWDSDDDEDTNSEDELDEYSPYKKTPIQQECNMSVAQDLQVWLRNVSDCESSQTFLELNNTFWDESPSGDAYEVVWNDTDDCRTQTSCTRDRVRHGFYRVFSKINNEFQSVGLFCHDIERGVKWIRVKGNAYRVQRRDENNNGVESMYVYPDLVHVIHGQYDDDGRLVRGCYGCITRVDYIHGVPFPAVKILNRDISYTSDPSTSFCISNTPLVRDLFEHERVYVDHSGIPYAGEGLFAKDCLEEGSLVSLFNGVRKRDALTASTVSTFSDYKIGLTREIYLDIPISLASMEKYCASLGHKCCHSFAPNAEFREIFHPRFGHIMSIVARRRIQRGEEVLVDYNYSLALAPNWYCNLYFHHLRNVEQQSEEFIYSWARKKSRESGYNITVPPPHPSSPRYVACGCCGDHVGLDAYSVLCSTCSSWYHVKCLGDDDQRTIQGASDVIDNFVWTCQSCKRYSP